MPTSRVNTSRAKIIKKGDGTMAVHGDVLVSLPVSLGGVTGAVSGADFSWGGRYAVLNDIIFDQVPSPVSSVSAFMTLTFQKYCVPFSSETVWGSVQAGKGLCGSITCFNTIWLKDSSLESHSSYSTADVGCLHLNTTLPNSPVSRYTGITSSIAGEIGTGAWNRTSRLGGGGGLYTGVGDRQS